jgi:hypothetical protein
MICPAADLRYFADSRKAASESGLWATGSGHLGRCKARRRHPGRLVSLIGPDVRSADAPIEPHFRLRTDSRRQCLHSDGMVARQPSIALRADNIGSLISYFESICARDDPECDFCRQFDDLPNQGRVFFQSSCSEHCNFRRFAPSRALQLRIAINPSRVWCSLKSTSC